MTGMSDQSFSTRHAYLTLGGVLVSGAFRSSLPLALIALASFGYWLCQQRALFRSMGFGPANVVTSLRLVSLVPLAASIDARRPLTAAALALAIFSLDGLDGYLARRTGHATRFGALYDAEVDANFTMLLTWGVFELGHAGAWVLIGGLLRYAYVLALHLAHARSTQTPRTWLSRYVFAISVSAYTLSLWPLVGAGPELSALSTGLLCYSFAVSFRASFAPSAHAG